MRTFKRWLTAIAVVASLAIAVVSSRLEADATAERLAAGSVVSAVDSAAVGAKAIEVPPTQLGAKFSPTVTGTLSAIERAAPFDAETIDAGLVDAEPAATTVEERGRAALAAISYPWQERLPAWEIRFHRGRTGAYGYTIVDDSVIDVYIRADQSDELLQHVIAHELGHAVDVTLNDGDDRRRWQETRAIEDHPWWPDDKASDFATGAGDFAESFAVWQVGDGSYRSRLGPAPNADQLALIAELSAG